MRRGRYDSGTVDQVDSTCERDILPDLAIVSQMQNADKRQKTPLFRPELELLDRPSRF